MKLLAVFFLLGLAAASAVPLFFENLDDHLTELESDLDDEFFAFAEEGGLMAKMRHGIENMLDRLKKGFDEGKGVSANVMKKLEDTYEKYRRLGGELSDKSKSILDDMRSKVSRQRAEGNLMQGFRERFENLLERVKKDFDDGKGVKGDVMKKLEDLYQKITSLGGEFREKIKSIFEDLRNRVGQRAEGNLLERFRERFENLLQRIKKNFDDGKGVSGNLIKKLEDLYEKFKNLGGELSDKMKSIFEDLRNRVGRQSSPQAVEFNLREIFSKLKKMIKEKFDADTLKTKVEEFFGKGSEMAEQLVKLLKEKGGKGKQRILDFIDRVLGEKEEEKRSIKEMYEKVKNYFKDLGIELKEKFAKFGEYVKERYQDALDKTKTKAENVKRIAKEFLEDTRKIGKDMGEEALDFFREYKKDLGQVYDDLVDKVREIVKNDS